MKKKKKKGPNRAAIPPHKEEPVEVVGTPGKNGFQSAFQLILQACLTNRMSHDKLEMFFNWLGSASVFVLAIAGRNGLRRKV